MLFHSTRGGDSNKTFEEVLLQGLASDGGLFMPNEWPQVNLDNLKKQKTFLAIHSHSFPILPSQISHQKMLSNKNQITLNKFFLSDITRHFFRIYKY